MRTRGAKALGPTAARTNTVAITVPCPYCGAWQQLRTGQTANAPWTWLGPSLKCSACGSRYEVSLQIKRKGKGAKVKEREAADRAELARKVAEAEARNEQILAAFDADPECICTKHEGQLVRQGKHGYGWTGSRYSTSVTNGVPNEPRHSHQCPRFKREQIEED